LDLARVKVFPWFELKQTAPLGENLEPFLLHISIALLGIYFSKFQPKNLDFCGFFFPSVNSTKIAQTLGKFGKTSISQNKRGARVL
jgi:hypothetical protein